jgi:branched-chain amino acid transport system substrate-binding protein
MDRSSASFPSARADDDRARRVIAAPRGNSAAAVVGVVFAAALAWLAPGAYAQTKSPAATSEPVRIGVLQSLSGAFAPIGPLGVNGAKLAVEGATVLGHPVEVIVEDDQSDPKAGAQKARKLINVDKVVAIEGMVGSSVGLAVSNVAAESKIPLILAGPSASELTGTKCQPSTFRVKPPTLPMVNAIVPYVFEHAGKKWYFIAYDYSWGQEGVKLASAILKEKGGEIRGVDMVPVGTQDYSSYLLKVRAAKPDVLFFMLGGNDAAALIKQFSDIGLRDSETLSAGVMDSAVAWQVGSSITGIYPVPFYHKSPDAVEFVKKYMARYHAAPDNQAWQDYTAVKSLIAAMNKAGSTEYAKVVKALEGLKLDAAKDRDVWYRDFDHQLMQTIYVVKAKTDRKAMTDQWDWGDIVFQSPAKDATLVSIFGTQSVVGCRLAAH